MSSETQTSKRVGRRAGTGLAGMAAMAGLFLSVPASAQQTKPAAGMNAAAVAELPPAVEILDRAQAVSMGEAAKAQKNRVQKGSFSVPAQNLSGTITVYSAPPNLFLNVIELPMIGKMVQGFDGTTAWASDPIQGPRLIEGSELEQTLLSTDFDADLKEHFSELETLGRQSFEGHDAWKVRMATASGFTLTAYFDVLTGLMAGMEMKVPTPMGEVPATMVMSDYADMAGMKVARRTVNRAMGMEQVLLVEEILVNVPDLPSFAPPPEVQALMRESAAPKN